MEEKSKNEYRDNLAKKLRGARELDKDLAQSYKEKIEGTKEYQNARDEKINEVRTSKNAEKVKNEEQVKAEKIEALKNEISNIGVQGESKPEIAPAVSVATESKDNTNESPEKSIFELLSTNKNVQEKFPVYNQDAEKMRELQKELNTTIEGVKSIFRQEYKKGLSLQDFYDKYKFFASEEKVKENNSKKGRAEFEVEAEINYNPGKSDFYSKKLWNEVLEEKFSNKEMPKNIEKSKTTYSVSDHASFKRNYSVNKVILNLSVDSRKTGVEGTSFLGINTGTKKVNTGFSTLSENAKFAILKRFGVVEPDYSGPLKQHKNFGGGEINRSDDEFFYDKVFPLSNIKGAAIEIMDYKAHNNGYKMADCKTKFEFDEQAIRLSLSKEFFDEVLKREMVK